MISYQIGNLTSQPKETILRFLQKKEFPNPADLLSKIDLEYDSIGLWMLKTQHLFHPTWLQQHPDGYLDKLLALSDEQISIQYSGG